MKHLQELYLVRMFFFLVSLLSFCHPALCYTPHFHTACWSVNNFFAFPLRLFHHLSLNLLQRASHSVESVWASCRLLWGSFRVTSPHIFLPQDEAGIRFRAFIGGKNHFVKVPIQTLVIFTHNVKRHYLVLWSNVACERCCTKTDFSFESRNMVFSFSHLALLKASFHSMHMRLCPWLTVISIWWRWTVVSEQFWFLYANCHFSHFFLMKIFFLKVPKGILQTFTQTF